jgi:hypothetical protein
MSLFVVSLLLPSLRSSHQQGPGKILWMIQTAKHTFLSKTPGVYTSVEKADRSRESDAIHHSKARDPL